MTQTLLFPQDLGNHLVLRRSTRADAEAVAAFNAAVHGENPRDAEDVAAWTRDLLTRPHPTFHEGDFLLIEDTQVQKIVAALCLIDQTWMLEGIPFRVGRPELVGTDPEYRNRGLIRRLFQAVHALSEERQQALQFITGIPYFYRQFGYEMALELSGGRWGQEQQAPQLKEGETEPYLIRLAQEADIPLLEKFYARSCQLSLVNPVMDAELWRYQISGITPNNVARWVACMIETPAGEPVGYLAHNAGLWGTALAVVQYALAEGVSYRAVTPSVIRYIWKVGQEIATAWEQKLTRFQFHLGSDHPVYHSNPAELPGSYPPYAFYMRVPDLPAFLRLLTPVLEARLSDSPLAGHTGELKISFYRSGVKFTFENGKLLNVEAWQPVQRTDEGQAAFPDLTFLHLVFGHLQVEDLCKVYADCRVNLDSRALVESLFPKKPSHLWAVT